MMKLRLIVEPEDVRAGAGRQAASVSDMLRRIDPSCAAVVARAPSEATQCAHRARQDGVDCLIVLGSAHLLNDVAQAYVEAGGAPIPGPDLALVPGAAARDLGSSLGLSHDPQQWIDRIAIAASRPVDLGIATIATRDGRNVSRAFVDVAWVRSGSRSRLHRWRTARGRSVWEALRSMAYGRSALVRLDVDGRSTVVGPVSCVALANGRYCDGGTLVAPAADLADGLLDVVALHDLARAQGVSLAHRIARGLRAGGVGVQIARGSTIDVSAIHPRSSLTVELDGRPVGQLPLHAQVAPGALRFRV